MRTAVNQRLVLEVALLPARPTELSLQRWQIGWQSEQSSWRGCQKQLLLARNPQPPHLLQFQLRCRADFVPCIRAIAYIPAPTPAVASAPVATLEPASAPEPVPVAVLASAPAPTPQLTSARGRTSSANPAWRHICTCACSKGNGWTRQTYRQTVRKSQGRV